MTTPSLRKDLISRSAGVQPSSSSLERGGWDIVKEEEEEEMAIKSLPRTFEKKNTKIIDNGALAITFGNSPTHPGDG